MAKTYRSYEPGQSSLLPLNPRDWLPDGHVALFVDDVVDDLDLSAIYAPYEQEGRGYPPHNPTMMTKVWFYAYTQGVHSSRQVERRCGEDIGFRVLAAGNQPDHVSLSRFRKRHLKDLAGLFVQVLRLCQASGLVKMGHVAIDGTKIKANASRHKAMSWGRLNKEEDRLKREIEKALQDGSDIDDEEDAADAPVPNQLPPGFETRAKRLQKIREAKERLRERAQHEQGDEDAEPDAKMQTNFTDHESRIMPTSSPKGAFDQAYNAQLVVDAKAQVILATTVSQTSTDQPHLLPLVDEVRSNTGAFPKKTSGDAGYYSKANVDGLENRGIVAFIPPDRPRHNEVPPPAPRGRIPAALPPKDRMRRRLRTKVGRATYRMRKSIAEAPLGLVKRVLGFRRFNLRGHQNAKDEWAFVATTYNVMKLYWANQAHAA